MTFLQWVMAGYIVAWLAIACWLLHLLWGEFVSGPVKRRRQVRESRERLARGMSADVRQCSRMPAEESEVRR